MILTEESRISVEQRGHVLLIGLNRPAKRNAFDRQMLNELAAAFTQLEETETVRCGVLFAHGEMFTAGLDLANVAPSVMAGENLDDENSKLIRSVWIKINCAKNLSWRLFTANV